jgi:hypothetical protein
MGLVCLVCGGEIDLSVLLAEPDNGLLCCPSCDEADTLRLDEESLDALALHLLSA